MIYLGSPKSRTENVFRLLRVKTTDGNVLSLLTNRFDWSAEEISNMYRSRWAIELFFKWIKQHVRIKTFYGQSQRAVYNQIFTALIVFCLNVLAQLHTTSRYSILRISRYLRAALWKSAHIWIRKIAGKTVP